MDPKDPLRRFEIKLNDKDYITFSRICNRYDMTVEEKIYEIIRFYLKIEENRGKLSLDDF